MERRKNGTNYRWTKNGRVCRNHDLPCDTGMFNIIEWRCENMRNRYLKHLPSSVQYNGKREWYEKGVWFGLWEDGTISYFPRDNMTISFLVKNKIVEMYKKN